MMRLKLNRILPLLVAAALAALAGCARHSAEWERLAAADAVMEELPDSALAILSAIDPASLATPEENARYALLMTQAQVKNGCLIDNDSLISRALEFYKTKKESSELMRSLFYTSEVGYNQGDFIKSIKTLMEAEEMAEGQKEILWLAKIEEMIADIYSNTHNYEEWAEYAMKASSLYKKIGKERNHRFLLIDYSTALANSGNSLAASELIDSIISLAERTPVDTILLSYGLKYKMPILQNCGNYKAAIDCYDRLSNLGMEFILTPSEEAHTAQAYLMENKEALANMHLLLADSLKNGLADESAIKMVQADYYEQKSEYKMALNRVREALEIQNGIVNDLLRESVSAEQRDYYNLKSIEERQKSNDWRNLFLIGITFIFFLLIAVAIYTYLNQKIQKSKLETKIHSIYLLTTFLDEEKAHNLKLSQKTEEMEREMESLFRSQWATLNFLCNQYFDKESEEKLRASITNEIKKEIEKLKNNTAQLEIERAVNRYMGNIIEVLKQECPFLKPRDIKFITFVMAGFTPTAVCIYTDISIDYFYLKRSTLIKKIKGSSAKHKDWFVSKLSNKN